MKTQCFSFAFFHHKGYNGTKGIFIELERTGTCMSEGLLNLSRCPREVSETACNLRVAACHSSASRPLTRKKVAVKRSATSVFAPKEGTPASLRSRGVSVNRAWLSRFPPQHALCTNSGHRPPRTLPAALHAPLFPEMLGHTTKS